LFITNNNINNINNNDFIAFINILRSFNNISALSNDYHSIRRRPKRLHVLHV